MTYIGNEQFSVGNNSINLTVNDFWRWSYSDLNDGICRSALAEFIVAASLEVPDINHGLSRTLQRPYDLISKDGYRIEVKAAAYAESSDEEHLDCISFGIAPAIMPGGTGLKESDASFHRDSDVFVFCVFKAISKDETPLDLDLWDFYILPTKVLNEKMPIQKTITLPGLMRLEPMWCDYYGMGGAIQKIMTA